MTGDAQSTLEGRYRQVLSAISDAAHAARRNPADITTIVVTKFHPISVIRQLHSFGHRDFGENRHQEAVVKHAELVDLDPVWHFIGQLQSNKAKAVAQYATVIHSIDRSSLVGKLGDQDKPVDIFVEVNLSDDPGRGGAWPDELMGLVDEILTHPHLTLRGLMAVAPQEGPPALAFDRVIGLQEEVLARAPGATELSIGMSDDFADAIAAGATHLRIGTAITGKRPTRD